jgi:hypothetical protein
MKQRYVLMKLQEWDKILAMTPAPQRISPLDNSVGFLLVYDSVAELHANWPDAEFVTITAKGATKSTATRRKVRARSGDDV